MYSRGHEGVSFLLYAPVAFVLLQISASYSVLAAYGALIVWSVRGLPDKDMKLKNYSVPRPAFGGRFGITVEWGALVKHRGITHSIWFALLIGGIYAIVPFPMLKAHDAVTEYAPMLIDPVILAPLIGLGFVIANVEVYMADKSGIGGLLAMIVGFVQLPALYDFHILVAFSFAAGVFGILAHVAGDILTHSGVKPLNTPWPFNRVVPFSGTSLSLGLTTAKNPRWNYGLFITGYVVLSAVFITGDPVLWSTTQMLASTISNVASQAFGVLFYR